MESGPKTASAAMLNNAGSKELIYNYVTGTKYLYFLIRSLVTHLFKERYIKWLFFILTLILLRGWDEIDHAT